MQHARRNITLIGVVVAVLIAAGLVVHLATQPSSDAAARSSTTTAATPSASSSGAATPPASASPAPPTASTAPAATLAAGDHRLSVAAGGRTRNFTLYVPQGLAASARPALVLVFHGADDTAADAEQQTGLDSAADSGGYLVAYLQGYENTWNEGAGHTPAEVAGVDDVAFAAAVVSDVGHLHPIDSARVAALGFSNGALLVDLLGCRLAGVVHVIIPVEGPLPVSVAQSCAPSSAVSVLEVHGTADTTIPYSGGSFAGVGGGTTVLSAPAAVARWAALDGCGGSQSAAGGASVTVTTYSGCRGGTSVALRTIAGGGHGWPSGLAGIVTQALTEAR